MNNLITIITICSRPQYLEQIYNSIISQNYDNYKWILSFDSNEILYTPIENNNIIKLVYKNKEGDITNYAALNNIFNNYIKEDTFIHIIDDDNILYPNYFNTINNIINSNKELQFIYYQQSYSNNNIRFIARTNDIKEGHIDTAQVCFHSSLIKNTRFIQKYTADGIFYKELINKIIKNKSKWYVLSKILCYYNFILKSTKESTILHQKALFLLNN